MVTWSSLITWTNRRLADVLELFIMSSTAAPSGCWLPPSSVATSQGFRFQTPGACWWTDWLEQKRGDVASLTSLLMNRLTWTDEGRCRQPHKSVAAGERSHLLALPSVVLGRLACKIKLLKIFLLRRLWFFVFTATVILHFARAQHIHTNPPPSTPPKKKLCKTWNECSACKSSVNRTRYAWGLVRYGFFVCLFFLSLFSIERRSCLE